LFQVPTPALVAAGLHSNDVGDLPGPKILDFDQCLHWIAGFLYPAFKKTPTVRSLAKIGLSED